MRIAFLKSGLHSVINESFEKAPADLFQEIEDGLIMKIDSSQVDFNYSKPMNNDNKNNANE